MDLYAVVGNPVAHSKSPQIHQMFAAQTGQTLQYERILAPIDAFDTSLRTFFNNTCAKGCNVTVPFKLEACSWVDALSSNAEKAGAVNTIVRLDNGRFAGENTDGIGLVLDLKNRNVELAGANILMLGAGGAARGVIGPLLSEQPASLTVANRTLSKAIALQKIFDQKSITVSGVAMEDLVASKPRNGFDVVINSTSASMQGILPGIDDNVLAQADTVYDMVYANEPTPFLKHAASLGVPNTFDGLGMLVGQAAESFYLWRGVRPDTLPIIDALRMS